MQEILVQFLGWEDPQEKGEAACSIILGLPWLAQLTKNLPTIQATPAPFLGWEDPLEKGTTTHSIDLAWRISWTVQSVHGVAKSQTRLGLSLPLSLSFPGGSDGKEAAYNAGSPGPISGSGKSPREENG